MNTKTLNKMTKDALVQEVVRLQAALDEANETSITQKKAGVVRYRLAEVVELDPTTRLTVLKELDALFQ